MLLSRFICFFICFFTCYIDLDSKPHIFDTLDSLCNILDTSVTVSNKIWNAKTKDGRYQIYFSLCKQNLLSSKCKFSTSACLFKGNQRNAFNGIDLGQEFMKNDDGLLQSVNGAKCPSNPNKNYTLLINFVCPNEMNKEPSIEQADDKNCEFQVNLLNAKCDGSCFGYIWPWAFIDFRQFPKNIIVPNGDTNFSLTMCGSSRTCRSFGISSCEILENNSPLPLATKESQHINYDFSKNELTARGSMKVGKKRRELEVLIKCNWENELMNVIYKRKPNEKVGRKYHFELHSNYGCIKMPQNCNVVGVDNNRYDLSPLYRNNSKPWEVAKVPGGRILLNICGPLKLPPKTICSDQYSQVCDVQNKINRGSILSLLEANEDHLRAVFTGGSTCVINKTIDTHSTEIEFRCSARDGGPVLKGFNDCVTYLWWETPVACPVYHYRGEQCQVTDLIGSRSVSRISLNLPNRNYQLTPTSQLIYNLCAPLHGTCNGYSNVSFCLKTNTARERVVGFENNQLINDHGQLKLELDGEFTANGKQGKVSVIFNCNYVTPVPKPQLNVLIVPTSMACLSNHNFVNCAYSDGEFCYDLSLLTLKDRNYVVKDPNNKNIEYIFNICGPVVTDRNALCRANAMVCLKNETAVNPKDRFITLGKVAGPKFVNNSLTIEAGMGTFCDKLYQTKTVINFECSKVKEYPRFVSENNCVYTFIWKTPQACSKHMKCVIIHPKSKRQLDLRQFKRKAFIININDNLKYEFNLCLESFKKKINGTEVSYPLKRHIEEDKERLQLVFDLGTNCSLANPLKIVFVELECDLIDGNEHIEERLRENCSSYITVKSKVFCHQRSKEFDFYDHNNKTNGILENVSYIHKPVENKPPVVERKSGVKCYIVNNNTLHRFNLSDLNPFEIIVEKNHYHINVGAVSQDCNGYLCKNGNEVVQYSTDCPKIIFNHTQSYIKVVYNTQTACGSKRGSFEIWLTCNKTERSPKIIKDDNCVIIVEIYLPDACDLLIDPPSVSVSMVVQFGYIGAIIFVLAGLTIFILLKKLKRANYRFISSQESACPLNPYYKDGSL